MVGIALNLGGASKSLWTQPSQCLWGDSCEKAEQAVVLVVGWLELECCSESGR